MHIEGRLIKRAVILINRIPFHEGYFSLREEFAPAGSKFFPLRAQGLHRLEKYLNLEDFLESP